MTSYRTKEEVGSEFRKQYDELGLKPPCVSMLNLERELILDFWLKTRLSDLESIEEGVEKIKATVEGVNGTSKYDSCYDDVLSYLKSLKQ